MNSPIISVVIPTYKPGGYLWQCLDSLEKQTLPKNKYEVIVVLNGEREPYFSQITAYADSHQEQLDIRLLYSEKSGVSNARNMGIDHAQGEHLTFVDDDDWVSDNYLSNLFAKADQDAFVASNVLLIDEKSGKTMDYFLTEAFKRIAGMERPSFLTARSFFSPPVCKLIPKTVIADDRFPTDFSLGEDSIFVFTISKRVKEIRFSSQETIYYVRYRESSASHKHYSYWFRVKLAFRTALRYISIYSKAPFRYDFMLFLSRVAATLRKLFWKSYQ